MRTSFTSSSRRHFCQRCFGGLAIALVGMTSCARCAYARSSPALRNIAFFYGNTPDFSELEKYQFVVLEPSGQFKLPTNRGQGTHWLAYVSVGEVTSLRDYYSAMPKNWVVGRNTEWGSELIDQGAPGWPVFFAERVIAPLVQSGYRGFFFDTLDSYQLFATDEKTRLRNQRGLIAVIREVNKHFPSAKIILNRGFELLPQIHDQVYAVAFESLFKGWSEARGMYVDVPQDDRSWLLDRARIVKRNYGLPVIAIDYCAPADKQCAHDVVRRIRGDGLIPYVSDGHLLTINLAALSKD
ncbi:hypothetical protein FQ179_04395 [Pusillimonas sp. ANT_WB101]|nr:hypothetical protein FQ179_04395 [Pusillimonas sp. ANT_WB101]